MQAFSRLYAARGGEHGEEHGLGMGRDETRRKFFGKCSARSDPEVATCVCRTPRLVDK